MPKRRRSPTASRARRELFNAPFRELRVPAARAAPGLPPAPDAPPAPSPRRATEEDLFRAAMEGVRPLPEGARADPPRPPPPPPRASAADEESEALARLADLCAGDGPFDWTDTSEYVEGCAPGVDRRLVRRLRKGEFAVQAHLDLHGMTRNEARAAVERFVATARSRGLRCVLVIHGRGLNSKDHVPVLKERLSAWLRRGRLGRSVLAFATARPSDGGAGALYVLLRR